MEKIKYTDINFSKLKRASFQGTNSIVYENENTYIKIFKGMPKEERKRVYTLYQSLDGYEDKHIIFPTSLIFKSSKLVGYTSEKKKAVPFSKRYESLYYNLDCKEFFLLLKKIIEVVRKLHSDNIMVADFSFENVLIDKNKNIYFCDTDSFLLDGMDGDTVSYLLGYFINIYRNENIYISKNTDRLSIFLSFLQAIYFVHPSLISKEYYKVYARKLKTLKALQPLFYNIMNTYSEIGEFPYIDEYLNFDDNFTIDRLKQDKIIDKKVRIYL